MRLHRRTSGAAAFTLIELLCVMAIIAVLAGLLLPALAKGKARARQAQCLSQLRQIGLGFHSFAHDHNSRFPMTVTIDDGGSSATADGLIESETGLSFGSRHFQPLSNHIVTPRLLWCPADTRVPAADFGHLTDDHVSYFVALGSSYDKPGSLLAGDGNIYVSGVDRASLIQLPPGGIVRWTATLHQYRGNLLFADGHVEQRQSWTVPAVELPTSGEATASPTSNRPAHKPLPMMPGSATPGGVSATNGNHPAQAGNKSSADAPKDDESKKGKGGQMNVSTTARIGVGEIAAPAAQPSIQGRIPEEPRPEVVASRSGGSEGHAEPSGNESWFAEWIKEVLEPLIREAGLALHFLFGLLIFATLWARRHFTAKPRPIRVDPSDL